MSWGSGTSNENKPNWKWLTARQRGNTVPRQANVVATSQGWAFQWPWGLETLVAIGGLDSALAVANVVNLYAIDTDGEIANLTAQTLSLVVDFNEPVTVSGSPTIVAISNNASPANATLTYSAGLSDPTLGKLVFTNAAVNVNVAVTKDGRTYTVNSTSTAAGWAGITDANANVVANGVPAALSANLVHVVSELPFQGAITPGANLANTTAQTLQFGLGFNRAVNVTPNTVVSLLAIGLYSNGFAYQNVTCTLNVAASNATVLVFKSAATSFAAISVNAAFTVNSTSVLVGFSAIKDLAGNTTANTISTAGTQNVIAA